MAKPFVSDIELKNSKVILTSATQQSKLYVADNGRVIWEQKQPDGTFTTLHFTSFEELSEQITQAKAYTDAKDSARKDYVDQEIAKVIDASPETLNTIKELAVAINQDPQFSTTIQNYVIGKFTELVNGETEYTTLKLIGDELRLLEADETVVGSIAYDIKQERLARQQADSDLGDRVTNLEGQVNGNIGELTSLATDEKGTIVGAINEVDAHVDSVISQANATVFTYASATALASHTIQHNLNEPIVSCEVWTLMDGTDEHGKWSQAGIEVNMIDNNTIEVLPNDARKVRVVVRSPKAFVV